MAELRARTSIWWIFIVLLAAAVFQIVWNPFGLSNLVQQYSQDLVSALVTGPLYGAFGERKGHDDISVTLIDDSTLAHRAETWPIAYRTHKLVLDALLARCPRAVVVDFLFVDPRPSDTTLQELTAEVGRYKRFDCNNRHGVLLYFESTANEPVLSQIRETGASIVDPTMLLDRGVARHYPIALCDDAGGNCRPSLAVRLYRDLCKQDGAFCSAAPAFPAGTMELWWGTAIDPINAKQAVAASGEAGCGENFSFAGRLYRAITGGLSGVQSGCPYHGVIPAEALLDGRQDADIDNLVHDRIVFYGASLEGAKDESLTPVNGLLPDIFVHAMALDNLITLRGKPLHDLANGFLEILLQILWITPVMLVLSWLRTRYARRNRPQEQSASALGYFLEWALEFGWVLLAILLAIAVGVGLMVLFQVSVGSWVGIVFVAAELAAIILIGLPEKLWGYARHVMSGVPHSEPQREP